MEKIIIEIAIILFTGLIGGVIAYFIYRQRISSVLAARGRRRRTSRKCFNSLNRTLMFGAFVGIMASSLCVGAERGYYAFIFNRFTYEVKTDLNGFINQNHYEVIKRQSRTQNEVYIRNNSSMHFVLNEDANIVDFNFSYFVDKNNRVVRYEQNLDGINLKNVADDEYADKQGNNIPIKSLYDSLKEVDATAFIPAEDTEFTVFFIDYTESFVFSEELLIMIAFNNKWNDVDILEYVDNENVASMPIDQIIAGKCLVYSWTVNSIINGKDSLKGYFCYYFIA